LSNFRPQRYVEQITKGKVPWKLVSDETTLGEHMCNRPFTRQLARRSVQLSTTLTEDQWREVTYPGQPSYLPSSLLTDLTKEIEQYGEHPFGGQGGSFEDQDFLGYRYYAGKTGAQQGVCQCLMNRKDDRVFVRFVIVESWPWDPSLWVIGPAETRIDVSGTPGLKIDCRFEVDGVLHQYTRTPPAVFRFGFPGRLAYTISRADQPGDLFATVYFGLDKKAHTGGAHKNVRGLIEKGAVTSATADSEDDGG
jgi:hypothetical protein